MSIEAEDVAQCIEAGIGDRGLDFAVSFAGRRIRQEAALVRALEAVRVAAQKVWIRPDDKFAFDELDEALAAVDKIRSGA